MGKVKDNFFFHLSKWVAGVPICDGREEEEMWRKNRFVDLIFGGKEILCVMVSIFLKESEISDQIFVAGKVIFEKH